MKVCLSTKEEWLYPDTPLKEMDLETSISMANNGIEGIKCLFQPDEPLDEVEVSWQANEGISASFYEMLDVYVGYNEVENELQDGQFVILEDDYIKPEYCTRKAPFRVYEPLRPIKKLLKSKNDIFALYTRVYNTGFVCNEVKEVRASLIISNPRNHKTIGQINVLITIYPIDIPAESLKVTNWFSLRNMATYHNDVEFGGKEHLKVIRKYAKYMRELRQTHFFIECDYSLICRGEDHYDFSIYEPVIRIFFEEGFETMEFGNFAVKQPSLFTKHIKCAFNPEIEVKSLIGYIKMTLFIDAVEEFLTRNGWANKTIYHICDEPDVHYNNKETLEARKQDYFKIANMIRKRLPNAKIIEAVKSTEFKSAIDIWVPLTVNYEESKNEYDQMAKLGDEVWTYVCCVPTGSHLNRFLDIGLIKSRLIFWGISKHNLSGYLHWGLNQQPRYGFNPFENSNTPNIEFDGLFPSGDAFIFYPHEEGPLISLRCEAQRKGAEDFELLKQLKAINEDQYEALMAQIIRGFNDYNDDVNHFELIHKKLLVVLSA